MKRTPQALYGQRSKFQRYAPCIFLLIFLIISLLSARQNTLTYDEPVHYKYGLAILALNSNRLIADDGRTDDSKMPFTALNALPGMLSKFFPASTFQVKLADITTGRLVTILFSMSIAWMVYHWSYKLYGLVPALFSLFLYVFEPNIIAHSQLVTTDVYFMGMATVSTYALWRYSQAPNWKRAFTFALLLGMSQLTKYTAIFLYPLLAVILLVKDLPDLIHLISTRNLRGLWAYTRRLILLACLVVMVSLLLINIGYLFNRTLTPFGAYDLQPSYLITLRNKIPMLKEIPVPLPYPYLQGLDLVIYRERTSHGRGPNYLLGQLSNSGFPYYYLVAWGVKVPLAIQISFLISIILYLLCKKGYRFLQNEWFLAAPVVFFTIYLDLFNRAQIGIRYFLVVFPFILIFCGSLMTNWQSFRLVSKMTAGLLAAYLIGSVLSYYPNYIPYFNELIIDRRMAYKVLADSNLDWGQASGYLTEYLKMHPEANFDPPQPIGGTVVVGPNELVGIIVDPATFHWIRHANRPVATIANTYLIFDLPNP
ncbi:MAG TPA: glycosyltransferase family 39 protein [Anaerolineales bacterium]|nr:glycosyltransferase family 39 protein [Anaerolineales bacterium]